MKDYSQISTRIFDTPLLISESKLAVILHVLEPRLGIGEVQRLHMMEDEDYGADKHAAPDFHLDGLMSMGLGVQFEERDEGHYVGANIAVVPVIGSLVQRGGRMAALSGMTSYGEVERMMNAAMNDPRVSEIIMEVDSPGGEVAGAFDAADRITAMRGQGKKITAVAAEFSASAAYLISSAADEIVVPRTGAVGSIGVVAVHFDRSKEMEKRGVAVTYVYAGDRKIEGNPYQPLSADAIERWKEEIHSVYGMFTDTVARNRGMATDAVRGTQAAMFTGSKAVQAGLANRVNSFANELNNAVIRQKGMSGNFRLTAPVKEKQKMENAEQQAAAVKAAEEAERVKAEAAKATQAAVTAERERAKAISTCEEAKGRETLAQECIDMGLTVEQAKKMLAAAPKPEAATEAFNRAMKEAKDKQTPNAELPSEKPARKLSSITDIFSTRAAVFSGAAKKTA